MLCRLSLSLGLNSFPAFWHSLSVNFLSFISPLLSYCDFRLFLEWLVKFSFQWITFLDDTKLDLYFLNICFRHGEPAPCWFFFFRKLSKDPISQSLRAQTRRKAFLLFLMVSVNLSTCNYSSLLSHPLYSQFILIGPDIFLKMCLSSACYFSVRSFLFISRRPSVLRPPGRQIYRNV